MVQDGGLPAVHFVARATIEIWAIDSRSWGVVALARRGLPKILSSHSQLRAVEHPTGWAYLGPKCSRIGFVL